MPTFTDLLDRFFYRPDEEVGELFDLAPALEDLPAPIEEEPPEEYLICRLEQELYGVPIERVREILKVPVLTELPRAAPNLLGVMTLRGEVLPVYDIKKRLHLRDDVPKVAGPEAELTSLPRSARVVVVRDEEGDAGVLVDAVMQVVKLRPSTIEQPPAGVATERDCITGLGRRRDELYILIDLQLALA